LNDIKYRGLHECLWVFFERALKETSLAIQPISGENVRPEDTVFILLGETTLDCIRKFLDEFK